MYDNEITFFPLKNIKKFLGIHIALLKTSFLYFTKVTVLVKACKSSVKIRPNIKIPNKNLLETRLKPSK